MSTFDTHFFSGHTPANPLDHPHSPFHDDMSYLGHTPTAAHPSQPPTAPPPFGQSQQTDATNPAESPFNHPLQHPGNFFTTPSSASSSSHRSDFNTGFGWSEQNQGQQSNGHQEHSSGGGSDMSSGMISAADLVSLGDLNNPISSSTDPRGFHVARPHASSFSAHSFSQSPMFEHGGYLQRAGSFGTPFTPNTPFTPANAAGGGAPQDYFGSPTLASGDGNSLHTPAVAIPLSNRRPSGGAARRPSLLNQVTYGNGMGMSPTGHSPPGSRPGSYPYPESAIVEDDVASMVGVSTGFLTGPIKGDATQQAEKRRKRRESHNAVERRRRDNINEKIKELANLLPMEDGSFPNVTGAGERRNSNSGGDGEGGAGNNKRSPGAEAKLEKERTNKGIVLSKSVDHIRYLNARCAELEARNRELEMALRGGGGNHTVLLNAQANDTMPGVNTQGVHHAFNFASPFGGQQNANGNGNGGGGGMVAKIKEEGNHGSGHVSEDEFMPRGFGGGGGTRLMDES
ncbi:Cell morphoproteinsis protein PAG1 [Saitoella coloradoensis]